MTVPVVPPVSPNQSQIDLPRIENPWLSVWWTTQAVTGVPEEVMGWLVAQGWTITDISQDNSTTPPTMYYSLGREGLQPWQVLLSLCNSFTTAANEARDANELRYNQVVANWTEMISSSQSQFEAQVTEQNAAAGVYIANLDSYMSAVDALISANTNQLVADASTANAALTEMNAKLSQLETNANTNAGTIGSLLSAQSGYLSTFLADFSAKLSELDANYSTHLVQLTSLISESDATLIAFTADQQAQTAALAAAYSGLEAELNGLLATAAGYLADISAEVASIIASLSADYNSVDGDVSSLLTTGLAAMGSHVSDFNAVLSLLETDYSAHAATATAFLTGLGTTELARINQQFAASLATQIQDLVDRGLYSSGVAADVTARNTRDRDEQIQALNDRLNREKLENQHKLYEQQVAMRKGTLEGKDRMHGVRQEVLRYQAAQIVGMYGLLQSVRDRTLSAKTALYQIQDANTRLNAELKTRLYEVGQAMRQRLLEEAARLAQLTQAMIQWESGQRDRLLEQVQQVTAQHLAGIEKQHASQQEISKVAMVERDALLGQLQEAVKGILAGKERYAAQWMQNSSTLAEHKHRAIAEKMNESVARLEGWKSVADENRKLMAYQLDERNKLLIGLYSFVEKREDISPAWHDMAQMIAGLGDSAGGWMTP